MTPLHDVKGLTQLSPLRQRQEDTPFYAGSLTAPNTACTILQASVQMVILLCNCEIRCQVVNVAAEKRKMLTRNAGIHQDGIFLKGPFLWFLVLDTVISLWELYSYSYIYKTDMWTWPPQGWPGEDAGWRTTVMRAEGPLKCKE